MVFEEKMLYNFPIGYFHNRYHEKREMGIMPDEQKKTKNRVSVLHSMRTKIMLLVQIGALCSCLMVLQMTVPRAEEELTKLTQNSMLSLVEAYAAGMETEIAEYQQDGRTLTYDAYAGILAGAKMEGVESSYAYMVSPDGTMLYHPTQSKVGKPVENEVVKGVVAKIQAGVVPQPEVVSYEFDGAVKYASYYVLSTNDIIVISSDEEEVLSGITAMMVNSGQGMLVVMVILAVVIFVVSGIMMKPLKKITVLINEIEELRFVSHPWNKKLVKGKDECGAMANAVAAMRESLRNVIQDIGSSSTHLNEIVNTLQVTSAEVNDSCTDNSATTEELAAGMQETTATTQTLVSSIEDMKDESDEIKRMSMEGEELSGEIEERAAKLKESATASVKLARDMFATLQKNSTRVIEEAKAVEKINELTEVIMRISSQTSLLALNASIEAARAGEAGKGFAVVATEIGNLANQTSETVADINNIVAEVNMVVRDMGTTLRDTTQFMETQVVPDYQAFYDVSNQYNDDSMAVKSSMTSIQESVVQLNETIAVITDGLEGISKTINESAVGVADIAEKTASVVNRMGENMDMVKGCQSEADQLKDIAARFYIEV
ncbi:methyl-accepting chemotaxis protein [bacterium 1XD8-76]|nr:methyl-accepting chemotaxis protein [bacterium 1XD8-76]